MTVTRLLVRLDVANLAIEINIRRGDVATQESGVGGEDGADLYVPALEEDQTNSRLPLVEVSNNGTSLGRHV